MRFFINNNDDQGDLWRESVSNVHFDCFCLHLIIRRELIDENLNHYYYSPETLWSLSGGKKLIDPHRQLLGRVGKLRLIWWLAGWLRRCEKDSPAQATSSCWNEHCEECRPRPQSPGKEPNYFHLVVSQSHVIGNNLQPLLLLLRTLLTCQALLCIYGT